MKKVLSFVLVLAMVLGCFSTVFAKEFADVAADADCHDAVAVLSDLGVCAGKSETSFDPEGIVNRAEMAAFIINALGITPTANATTKFTDVAPSKWYSGYVAYANSLGIISGRSATTFDPEAQVSYDEAITMLINALGYTVDSLTGTYPAAYVSKAKTLGILEGVDTLGSVKANRGDIAIMLYNTLTKNIGHTDKDGQWTASVVSTLPTVYDSMMVRLGAGIMNGGNPFVVSLADVENAAVDISAYLGAYVTAYGDENGIVAIYEVKSEFVTGEFDNNAKFDKYTIDSGALLQYKDAENHTQPAAKFYNGKADSTLTPDYTGKETYTIAAKISGKHITAIYSIQSWEETDTQKMTDALLKDLTKNDKLLGKTFEKNTNDEIDTDSFILLGADSLADIKKDDVVSIYVNGKITKVTVGTDVVTGKVTKISGTDITVNGTVYETDSVKNLTAAQVKDLSFKTEYNLFLDYDGDVRFIEEVEDAEAETFYGVVMDAALSGTSWASETAGRQVKLFTQEGKEVVLPLKAKLASGSALYFTTEAERNTIAKSNMVVAYTLNDDGEIATAVEAAKTAATKVGAKLTVNGYYFADDAVIFEISGNTTDGFEYAVKKAADYAGKTVTAKYDLDESKVCVMVVTKASSSAVATNGIYVGEAKVGTDKYEVTFFVDGAEKVYNTTKTSGLTVTNLFETFSVGEDKVTLGTLAATEYKAGGYVVGTTGASIKGNTLYLDDNGVAVDAEVKVYVYDQTAKKLTIGSAADLATIAEGDKVFLYDVKDDDDATDSVYEAVVIWLAK